MVLAKLGGALLAAWLSFADPFTFEYAGQTDSSGTAFLVVRANDDIKDVDIVIAGDGQQIKKSLDGMKAGSSIKLTWKQKAGQAKYQLDVRGKGVEANFNFEIVKRVKRGKVGKLKVRSSRQDIVIRQTATFETTFDLTSYEYKIYDGEGDVVSSDTVVGDVKAGESFTVKWDSPEEIFMVFVRGEDQFGRFTEYKLVPWSVEIPHTEINFDTGKWDVKNDEAPKLDEAVAVAFHELVALEKVNKAVNGGITPRLYIVGYTDTVGSTASNDKLSNNRAKAIAQYFKKKGFWAAIYYAGRGERALRVETGDNVDEVRNRRALYVIGVQDPPPGGQIPSRWTKLASHRQRPAGFTLPPLPEKWANFREERRAKIRAARSGGGDMEGELPGGDDGGSGVAGDGGTDVDPSVYEGDDDGGGPPPVEGEPGGTKKGCTIAPSSSPAWGLAILLLAAVSRRRDRRSRR